MRSRTVVTIAVFAALLMCLPAAFSSESDADPVDYTHFYYDQLNSLEKEIYDKAVAMTPGHASFTVETTYDEGAGFDAFRTVFSNSVSKVNKALSMENPWMYWLTFEVSMSHSYLGGNDTVTLNYQENHYYDGIANPDADINSVIAGMAGSVDTSTRLNTVTSIHDYVIGHMSYYPDREHIPDTTDIRSIYTALVAHPINHALDRVVVCEGYAKTFKVLCDHFNVPCIIVTGLAGTGGGPGNTMGYEGHMWNMVQMNDGNWYTVDCTWDDQTVESVRHTYFLVGGDTVGFEHTAVRNSHVLNEEYTSKFLAPTLSTLSYSDATINGDLSATVHWTYSTSDCALIIEGTGAVPAKASYGWEPYASEVSSVSVSDGITGLPSGVFSGFSALQTLVVADSVTTVGSPLGITLKNVRNTADADLSKIHGESFTGTAGVLRMDARQYDAVFMADGHEVARVKYTLDMDSIVNPDVPRKTGYIGAWETYTLDQYGITVNAVYTKEKYKITFVDPIHGNTERIYEYNDTILAPSYTPTKSDEGDYSFEFVRWDGFSTGKKATGEAEFPAVFVKFFNGVNMVDGISATVTDEELNLRESIISDIKTAATSDTTTTFTVNLSSGKMVLDSAAIAAISSGDKEFSIHKMASSELTSVQRTLVGSYSVYSVFVSGGLTGGSITVTVPFDTSADTSVLKACYIQNSKITEKYDVEFGENTATFTVPHLSMFAIMDPDYKAPAAGSSNNDFPIPLPDALKDVPPEMLYGAILVVIILIIAAVVIHRRH